MVHTAYMEDTAMTETNTKIFISYRRQDSPDFAERICDELMREFQRENVFIDFDKIPPFVKFADFIKEKVQECDVMVAIIGPNWVRLMKEKAMNFEEDFVRIELALALQLGKLIAPICIKGATMPLQGELPEELRSMLQYNAASVDSGRDFSISMKRIVDSIRSETWKSRTQTAKGFFESGFSKAKANNLDGAIADFTEIIRLIPNFYFAYLLRGKAKIDLEDFQGAVEDFSEVLRLEPQNIEALSERGSIYLILEKYELALDDFNRVIELAPENADAFNRRAYTNMRMNYFDKAISDFDRAIQLDSTNSVFYLNRGRLYAELGDHQRATEDFTQAIILDANNLRAFMERGISRMQLADYIGGIYNFSEILKVNPTDTVALLSRGVAYGARGNMRKALADFNKAIRLNPRNAEGYKWRGHIYRNIDEPLKAIMDYQKYLELGGGKKNSDQNEIETILRDLKSSLD